MNQVKTGTNTTEHRGFAHQEGEDNEAQVLDIRIVQVITIIQNTGGLGAAGLKRDTRRAEELSSKDT